MSLEQLAGGLAAEWATLWADEPWYVHHRTGSRTIRLEGPTPSGKWMTVHLSNRWIDCCLHVGPNSGGPVTAACAILDYDDPDLLGKIAAVVVHHLGGGPLRPDVRVEWLDRL